MMNESNDFESLRTLQEFLSEEESKIDAGYAELADRVAAAEEALGGLGQAAGEGRQTITALAASARERVEQIAEDLRAGRDRDAETQQRIQELESEAQDKEQALTAAHEQNRDLESRLGDVQETSAKLDQQCEELRGVKAQLEERIDRSDEKLSATESERDRFAQELSDAQAAVNAAEERAQRIESEMGGAGEALEEARNTVASAEARIEQIETEKNEAEEYLAAAREEAESLRAELDGRPMPEALASLEQEMAEEQQRSAELEALLQDETARGTKSVLAEQLSHALKDAEDAREALRALQREKGVSPTAKEPADDGIEDRLREAAQMNGDGQKPTIGKVLQDAGLIGEEEVEAALEVQKASPSRHLGGILVEQGATNAENVAMALACLCNTDYVQIGEDSVAPDTAALINERLAKQHRCVPVKDDGDHLTLALVNPMDLVAIEDVERATDRKVEAVVATEDNIREAIGRLYWAQE